VVVVEPLDKIMQAQEALHPEVRVLLLFDIKFKEQLWDITQKF
jgi:hypothetical protein